MLALRDLSFNKFGYAKIKSFTSKCSTYTINSASATFIDLNRQLTSNFVNPLGNLQTTLSGDYKIETADFNGDGRITKRLISYNCDENKAVELYSLEGEGHIWWNRAWGHDINTSELIWQFFKNQQ